MTLLQIYELDSNENPISVLHEGEHIFGRGELLKCNDLRVSRKHGVIKVTGKTATITAIHHNPCFYQAVDSRTITLLPKDSPVEINDGDKFALLADQFWFKIKFVKSNGEDVGICSENGDLSPLPFTSAPGSSKMEDTNSIDYESNSRDFVQQKKHDNLFSMKPGSSKTNELGDNKIEDDYNVATQKRPYAGGVEPFDNKKAKFDQEKQVENEEVKQLFSVLQDLNREDVMSDSDGENRNSKEVTCEYENHNNKELELMSDNENNEDEVPQCKDQNKQNKKEVMSDSENDAVKIEPGTSKKGRQKRGKAKELDNSAKSAHDAELKAMLFSSDDDEEEPKKNPFKETGHSIGSKNDGISKIVNTTNKEDSSTKPNENTKRNDDNNIEKGEGSNAEHGDKNKNGDDVANVAAAPGTSRVWRNHCWYGIACYRKNASHLAEYSHPGDSDYESDPNDNRDLCPYGATCYRRNKDHRQKYKHPRKPQKPGGKRTKKKDNRTALPKKRTARKKYNDESSEDSYDFQDPFLCDSGTEYEATSSDEDDSDSDWSAGSEEETKRLLKEAKKFTKGKKKDKDGYQDDSK